MVAGSVLKLTDAGAFADGKAFCAFTAGETGTRFAPFSAGACVVPEDLGGEVYVTISSSGAALSDDTILAGYATLYFPGQMHENRILT